MFTIECRMRLINVQIIRSHFRFNEEKRLIIIMIIIIRI